MGPIHKRDSTPRQKQGTTTNLLLVCLACKARLSNIATKKKKQYCQLPVYHPPKIFIPFSPRSSVAVHMLRLSFVSFPSMMSSSIRLTWGVTCNATNPSH